MSSSAPRSVERRPRDRHCRALAAALAALALLAAEPGAAAEAAFETCDAQSVDAAVLTLCLEGLAAEVAQELGQVQGRALDYFAGLDAITGNDRASRTLAQAQAAFALYRELDCHLAEIDQGLGSAAVDRGRACRIDHDNNRIASLVAMIGDAEPAPEPEATAETEAGPEAATDAPLLATTWRVVEIEGEPTAAEIETTLDIDAEGAIAGIGGCNRYSTTAEISAGGDIAMGPIGATRMACEEAIMAQETRYFAALERVAGFALDDDGLALADQAGTVLVRLEPRTE